MITIEIISSINDISGIENGWNDVILSDSEATLFQTIEWTYHYMRRLLGQKEACIMLFRDANELCGILPLQIRRLDKIFVYEFLGARGTEYLMPIAKDEFKEAIYTAFEEFVLLHINDSAFVFEDIPKVHSFCIFLENKDRDYEIHSTEHCPCYSIELPRSWMEYKARLSKRMSKEIEYDRRYLTKNSTKWSWTKRDYFDLKHHYKLNKKRRHSLDSNSTYDDEWGGIFWNDYFDSLKNNNVFNYYTLDIDGEIAATIVSVDFKNVRNILSLGLNTKYEKLSPGNILLGLSIEDSIKNGIEIFDLSRGPDQYKTRLGCTNKMNLKMIIAKDKDLLSKYETVIKPVDQKIGFMLSKL